MISGVPVGAQKAAFRAFCREIQGHALLANKRIVKTWRTWDGSAPVAPPTDDEMPAVQLRLVGGSVKRVASTRRLGGAATYAIQSEPSVLIELWVKGCDQGDAQDLGDLIDSILTPLADTARQAIQKRLGAVGIRDWRLEREILPPGPEAFGETSLYAAGSYRLTLILNS